MIKNIIFDLGNVLVGVDFEKAQRKILSAGVSEEKCRAFFNKNIRKKYESGRMTTREFLDSAYKSLGRKVPKTKLRFLFENMFFEMHDMKNFLIRLRKSNKFRLYLFSNTNPLHFIYIKKKFGYIKMVDKFILSYKLKMIKPDVKIFKTVLKKYNFNPSETLFIDDLKDNCHAAEKFGIKTICYKNYGTFVKQFNKISNLMD